MKKLATINRVLEVLDYNPTTGDFFWKERKEVTKWDKTWNKRFARKKTGYKADMNGNFCIQICLDNKLYRAHRLAWAHTFGEWPAHEIDHINMDSCDNRICNLREATRSQNERNKAVRADNSLGVKGVYYDLKRNKYMVQLKVGNLSIKKRVDTLEQAKELYGELASKHHGEFMRVA